MDGQIKKRRTLEAIKRIALRESLNQPLIVIFRRPAANLLSKNSNDPPRLAATSPRCTQASRLCRIDPEVDKYTRAVAVTPIPEAGPSLLHPPNSCYRSPWRHPPAPAAKPARVGLNSPDLDAFSLFPPTSRHYLWEILLM